MAKKSGKKASRKSSPKAKGGGSGEKEWDAANAAGAGGGSSGKLWLISSGAAALLAVAAAGYLNRGGGNVEIAGNEAAEREPLADVNRSLEQSDDVAPPVKAEKPEKPDDAAPAKAKPEKVEAAAATTSSFAFAPLGPPMEASIAAFHSVQSDDPSSQREGLLRYLMYDDGYSACLAEESVQSDKFGVRDVKIAKWRLLNLWSNVTERWVASLPPKKPRGGFVRGREMASAASRIESTCRLVTLNHDDYGGRASEVLWDVLFNGTASDFYLDEPQGDASEYRTAACLSRFLELSPEARNKDEKYARDVLRHEWARRAMAAKERADVDLLGETELPYGWKETRDESGYSFYFNPDTQKTTWIRPVVRKGEPGKKETPPGPHEESGKVKHSALTVRNQPCELGEDAMKFADEDNQ